MVLGNLKLLAALFGFVLCLMGNAKADDLFTYKDFLEFTDNMHRHVEIDGNREITYKFSDIDNEDLTLHLFLNNQSFSDDMPDAIAKDLNSIAPAAGLKIKMGF